jgi:hypothetical protein
MDTVVERHKNHIDKSFGFQALSRREIMFHPRYEEEVS